MWDSGRTDMTALMMFEQHADTKPVNAMSLGLTVVSSQEVLFKDYTDLGNGVLAAGGPKKW